MDGKDINIHDFVSQQEIEQVQQAQQELQHPEGLKPYFEHFQEQLPYFKIRLALSVMEKEKK